MKIKIMLLFIVLVLLITGCGKIENKKDIMNVNAKDKPPLCELYIRTQGNISYCRIYSIQQGKIEFERKLLELRRENLTIDSIGKASNDRAYGTVYINRNGGVNNKVLVFRNGEIQKTISLDKYGTSSIITDEEKELSYVSFAIQPASYNLDGTPYNIIKNDQVIKPFSLKGTCEAYDVGNKFIYLAVMASDLGYENVPDNYLATIDRNTQDVRIINDKIETPISLSVNPVNKNIYTIVRNPYTGDSNIFVYGENGNFQKEIKLGIKWANEIHINSNGIAYITHGDISRKVDEPHCVVIMDTVSEKMIGQIDTPKGPNKMNSIDNYLFISNYPSNSVSVIDMGANELLANMEGISDGKSDINEIVIIKH